MFELYQLQASLPITSRAHQACSTIIGAMDYGPFLSPEAALLLASTSGQIQWDSSSEWLCKHNTLRPKPIRFVRLDSQRVQSGGKSVNCKLPVLDLARGRDSWCWPKAVRPLGTRMGYEPYWQPCFQPDGSEGSAINSGFRSKKWLRV